MHLFESKGRAWRMSLITPGMRMAFGAWCRARAWEELRADKAFLSREEYLEQVAELRAAITAGDYNWGTPLEPEAFGRVALKMVGTIEGQCYLASLLLAPEHGQLTSAEVKALLTDNQEGFTTAFLASINLPNSTTPEATPGNQTTEKNGSAPDTTASPTTTSSPSSSASLSAPA